MANFETVETWLMEGKIKPKRSSISDLAYAADWLGQYETDETEAAQRLANAIRFLENEIQRRHNRTK